VPPKDEDIEREAIQHPHGSKKPQRKRVLRVAGSPDDDPRPLVYMQAGELHQSIDEGIAALEADPDLYQRDHALVHVTLATEEDLGTLKIVPGTPQIHQISTDTLRERCTRYARWLKYDKRSEQWERANPTDNIVRGIAARKAWSMIRKLVGIVESPSLRPDGTVIDTPGYDPATAFLYCPNGTFWPVVPKPTQVQARAALAELEEVFCDFPHRSQADRSAVIAAILTILARPAIRGAVPGFIFDASTRGSGKTLQTDVVSVIGTGRSSARMNYPTDEAELEKILAAYALRAPVLINFDNVTSTFGGGPLDRCLTAEDTVELRVLGKSEVPILKWRSIIMATGNNVVFTGDTSRRVLVTRLESPLENPEDRSEFRHPELLHWVRSERARLVCAALTILRAYHVAGMPIGPCKTWGSFEAWAALIPPAIVYAGGADPMLTRPTMTGSEDQEKQALAAILRDWPRLDASGQGMTVKTAIGALYTPERLRGHHIPPDGYDDLREAIEALVPAKPGMAPDANKLGWRLGRFKDRVIDGRKLVRAAGGHGIGKWSVVSVADDV
jgi:hypothetical protein